LEAAFYRDKTILIAPLPDWLNAPPASDA